MNLARPLNAKKPDARGECVLYWMQNSQRAHDNRALSEAVRRANREDLPVHVFFGLDPAYPAANARSYTFMLDGLRETARSLEEKGIAFHLRVGSPASGIVALARETRAREVLVDGAVLRVPRLWRQTAADALQVPLTEVWADTVIPPDAFGKLAAGAYVIRPFIHRLLDDVEWEDDEPAIRRPVAPGALPGDDVARLDTGELLARLRVDRSVPPVTRFPAGSGAARRRLRQFVDSRLAGYDVGRNRADLAATSELSPYLHFGQIGPHEIVREVRAAEAGEADKAAFLEQLLVRRELSWNHAFYNPDYDRFDGLPEWGRDTLAGAAGDPRKALYSLNDLEASATHDEVWNAANREMTATGFMHNYMRMLWAKRILEWSETPEEAFERAVYLNDRYELDGRDPNGYAGIAWSIGGRHDRPWPRPPVFGSVRYMSSESARRKMNIPAYIRRVEEMIEGETGSVERR
jgi:deoxyribodipyrimidine photo-lyase